MKTKTYIRLLGVSPLVAAVYLVVNDYLSHLKRWLKYRSFRCWVRFTWYISSDISPETLAAIDQMNKRNII